MTKRRHGRSRLDMRGCPRCGGRLTKVSNLPACVRCGPLTGSIEDSLHSDQYVCLGDGGARRLAAVEDE